MPRALLLHRRPFYTHASKIGRQAVITTASSMLVEHLPALEGKRIVLASASPRRRELLQQMGLQFEVVVSSFKETLPKEQYSAADYARHTALHKAMDVARQLQAQAAVGENTSSNGGDGAVAAPSSAQLPVLVIGADTVVEHGAHILEKPADAEDAARVLRMLSGTRHRVHTGVALVLPPLGAAEVAVDVAAGVVAGKSRLHSFSVTTIVEFDELSDEAVRVYITSGEPFGKAGSYGIQGLAGSFVRGIEGCYFNVVGFPLHRFSVELAQLIQSGTLQL